MKCSVTRLRRSALLLSIGVATLASLAVSPSALATTVSAVPARPAPPETSEIAAVVKEDGTAVFTGDQARVVVHPAKGPEPSVEELSTLQATITCNLNVQNVHGSTHFAGTINGVAKVTCTAAVAQLKLHYSLIRVSPNNTQWAAGSVSNTGKATIQNNKAVNCSQGPGQFQGWAQGELVLPPGYVLVGSATESKYGLATQVRCGSVPVAMLDDASGGVTTSLTLVRSDLAD